MVVVVISSSSGGDGGGSVSGGSSSSSCSPNHTATSKVLLVQRWRPTRTQNQQHVKTTHSISELQAALIKLSYTAVTTLSD